MIIGTHLLIHVGDPEKARAFFRDILLFPSIDAGEDWLVFALPSAEMRIDKIGGTSNSEFFLMCDNIKATVRDLKDVGVDFTEPIMKVPQGFKTWIKIPGGGEIGLIQASQPIALNQK